MIRSEPLVLVAPTRPEYGAVRAAVADRLTVGSVRLTLCGMGPASAAALCRRLESLGPLSCIALLGWAGGLAPDLVVGDVVVADAAVDGDGRRVPLVPFDLPGAHIGALLTVSAPLLTPQAKRDAWAGGVLAVEMEAYPLAEWAAAHDLSLIHARVILDTAQEALPDLGAALDPYGHVRPLRLAQQLLSRPRLALSLPPLARRVREVAPTLRSLARAVVATWSA